MKVVCPNCVLVHEVDENDIGNWGYDVCEDCLDKDYEKNLGIRLNSAKGIG